MRASPRTPRCAPRAEAPARRGCPRVALSRRRPRLRSPARDAPLDPCTAPRTIHSVPSWPSVSMRASAMARIRLVFVVISCSHVERPLRVASMARLRSALRPLASTPEGCTSGVRLTLRDKGRSSAASGRARAAESRANATATRAGRNDAADRSVAGERRSSGKRAGPLRYDPQCGGEPSGVTRGPVVPFTWIGIEARTPEATVTTR